MYRQLLAVALAICLALELPVAAYAAEQFDAVGETVSDDSIDTSEMVSDHSINVPDTTDNQPEEDDNGEENDGLFDKMKESVQVLSEVLMGDGDRALNELRESNSGNSLSDNGWSVSENRYNMYLSSDTIISANRLYYDISYNDDYRVLYMDTVSANMVSLKFYADMKKEKSSDNIDFLDTNDVWVYQNDVYLELTPKEEKDLYERFLLSIRISESLKVETDSTGSISYTYSVSGNNVAITPSVSGNDVEIHVITAESGAGNQYKIYPYYRQEGHNYKCAVAPGEGLSAGDSCRIPGVTDTEHIYYVVRQVQGQKEPFDMLLMYKGDEYTPAERLLVDRCYGRDFYGNSLWQSESANHIYSFTPPDDKYYMFHGDRSVSGNSYLLNLYSDRYGKDESHIDTLDFSSMEDYWVTKDPVYLKAKTKNERDEWNDPVLYISEEQALEKHQNSAGETYYTAVVENISSCNLVTVTPTISENTVTVDVGIERQEGKQYEWKLYPYYHKGDNTGIEGNYNDYVCAAPQGLSDGEFCTISLDTSKAYDTFYLLKDSEGKYWSFLTGAVWPAFSTKAKESVVIEGITVPGGTYNKSPFSCQGTAVVTSQETGTDITDEVKLDFIYSGTKGTVYGPSSTAPTHAGSYILIVSVSADNESYTGSREYPFEIRKAPVTITAKDVRLSTGDVVPGVYEYDVSGLLEGDSLTTAPLLSCTITSTDNAGTYDIIPGGADAGPDYEITYQKGTLTVEASQPAYSVTFDIRGHGTAPEAYTGITAGSKIEEPSTPTASGFTFTGWYKEAECKNRWNFAEDVITGDTVLYAGWEPMAVSYTVSFDLQGYGSMGDTTVVSGGKLEKPSDPVASGHIFTGWYKEPECQTLWDFTSDTVIENITLYAGWEADEAFEGVFEEDTKYAEKGLWAAPVDPCDYTGKAIKPEVRVYYGDRKLDPGIDYIVSYKNNTKAAADNSAKPPTIVVKGKGIYAGNSIEPVKFTIRPIALSSSRILAEDIELVANNKVQKKIPVLTFNGKKLANKKDFILPDDYRGYSEGEHDLVLIAKEGGNFIGTRSIHISIRTGTSMSRVKIGKIASCPYTGEPRTPKLEITVKKTPLEESNYTVQYLNNVEIGTATVIVTGKGNYVGTKKATFRITGGSIKKAKVTGIENGKNIYDGSLHRPVKVELDGVTLRENVDYTALYSNHKNVGKASVTITGIKGYTGTIKKTFKITAYDLGQDNGRIGGLEEPITATFAGKKGSKPRLNLTFDGKLLREGRDYTLTCKNNKAVTTDDMVKKPTVTIKGKGNFKGKISDVPFTIVE